MPSSTGLSLALLVSLGIGSGPTANADELQDVCRDVEKTLKSVKGARVSRVNGSFTFHDAPYRGCIVTLKGDETKVAGSVELGRAFFYPLEGTPRHQQGWRADEEADGPDGTAFRFYRGQAFCLVRGSWDGGDDSDPTAKRSPLFEYQVSCTSG